MHIRANQNKSGIGLAYTSKLKKMILSNSDALNHSIGDHQKKKTLTRGQAYSNVEKQRRFELKPFHLLMIVYGAIVGIGIVFRLV